MAHSYFLRSTSIRIRKYSNCISLNDVYILSGARTPIGRFSGKLASQNVVQLGTTALTAAIERASVNKEEIQEFVLGNFCQAGAGLNPAHQMAVFSGLSNSVVTSMVNKACASGMKAIMYGCQLITSNAQEIIAAGGAESMSNIPYAVKRQGKRLGNLCMSDLIFSDGIDDPIEGVDVTFFAEETAKDYQCTRKDQDDYTFSSYEKASVAQRQRIFEREIVPVIVKEKKGEKEEVVCEDEQIGALIPERVREIKPDVGKGGTITSMNSAGFHDGAAMLILASGNYVLKKNLNPVARIVSFADGAIESRKIALASSVAVPRALLRANLRKDDINRWEISETFAIIPIINSKILKLDMNLVNVCGGTISLGHPFGMTGARLIVHLANVLSSGELGCATISHAPGGSSAIIIEKL